MITTDDDEIFILMWFTLISDTESFVDRLFTAVRERTYIPSAGNQPEDDGADVINDVTDQNE